MTQKEVVAAFYKALDNNEMEYAEKLLSPQHQMYSTMSPQPLNAREHLGMQEAFNKGFTNQRHVIEDMVQEGNKVAMRGIWYGTHTGEFNGIAATGKEVHLSFLTIVEVANGTMNDQWMEADVLSLLKQLGVM